ncbi:hypothetical protein M3Y99_01290800 [Aphelenchoides fujianensis]|nr:hypothetical protein M3Y99_01290800 [Aphelenchoides fujianensis]
MRYLTLEAANTSTETPCADQTQQHRRLFWHICVHTPVPSCIQERVVFDDCFARSIRAVRAPFNGNDAQNDEFFDAAERYRAQLEQCFHGSEPQSPDPKDAIYARAIYGTEQADHWSPPDKPTLDPQDACLVKSAGLRLFGGGISRVMDTAQPAMNNLTTSCLLETEELTCYRHFLDRDSQFRQMLKNRDRALRTGCGLNGDVGTGNSQRIRSCICNAREAFDSRVKKAILECARKSPLAQLYNAIVDMSDGGKPNGGLRAYAAAPPRKYSNGGTHSGNSKETSDPTQSAASDDPIGGGGSAMSITQGTRVVLNGQCFGSAPSRQFSTDYPLSSAAVAAAPPPVDVASLQQQRLQQQWQQQQQQLQQQFIKQQQQLYQHQAYAAQPHSSSALGMLTAPARSLEAGIGDGFERFFQGQPPIRRRDVSSRRKIQRL